MPVESVVRLARDRSFGQGTLSASSQVTERRHVLERAFDWRTDTGWRAEDANNQWIMAENVPGNGPFNYLALAGHNLGSLGGQITFQTRSGPTASWQNSFGPQSVNTNDPVLFLFSEVSNPDARLVIENVAGVPEIAVLSAGAVDEFPEGAIPPVAPAGLNKQDEVVGGNSSGGDLIGARRKRSSATEQLQFDLLPPDWVHNTWKEIRESLREQGCFLAWNYDNYPDDVIFGFITDDSADHDGPFFMSLSLTVKGKA